MLERAVPMLVRWFTRSDVKRAMLADAEPALSWTDAWLLGRITDTGPVRLSQLADWQEVDRSTMTTEVRRLENLGLVDRGADPRDGRAVLVSATRVGALLLGVPTPDGLRFAGRVGSGLASEVAQRALRGRLVDADRSPFTERVPRPDEKGARWCEPQIVVEVSHIGWTDAGKLRAPVYRDVRDDLRPADVRQEP